MICDQDPLRPRLKSYKAALRECRKLGGGAKRDECLHQVNRRFGQDEESYRVDMKGCAKYASPNTRDACGIEVNKRYERLKQLRRERGGGGGGHG